VYGNIKYHIVRHLAFDVKGRAYMKSTKFRVLIAGVVLSLGFVSAQAHHSFSAIWDIDRTFEMTGVLVKVDWINPHSYVYVNQTGADGKVVQYSFEGFPPMMLRHFGVSKEAFASHIGQKVTVTAYVAKDGTKTLGFGRFYKFEDGTTIVALRDPKDVEAAGDGR
jgi:hypothetical protein